MKLGMKVGLGQATLCYMGTSPPPQKKGGIAPNFLPMSVVAKRLDGLRCHWVWRCETAECEDRQHKSCRVSRHICKHGNIVGVIWRLEETFEHPLQWLICLLHINELLLRHLFEACTRRNYRPARILWIYRKVATDTCVSSSCPMWTQRS